MDSIVLACGGVLFLVAAGFWVRARRLLRWAKIEHDGGLSLRSSAQTMHRDAVQYLEQAHAARSQAELDRQQASQSKDMAAQCLNEAQSAIDRHRQSMAKLQAVQELHKDVMTGIALHHRIGTCRALFVDAIMASADEQASAVEKWRSWCVGTNQLLLHDGRETPAVTASGIVAAWSNVPITVWTEAALLAMTKFMASWQSQPIPTQESLDAWLNELGPTRGDTGQDTRT